MKRIDTVYSKDFFLVLFLWPIFMWIFLIVPLTPSIRHMILLIVLKNDLQPGTQNNLLLPEISTSTSEYFQSAVLGHWGYFVNIWYLFQLEPVQ